MCSIPTQYLHIRQSVPEEELGFGGARAARQRHVRCKCDFCASANHSQGNIRWPTKCPTRDPISPPYLQPVAWLMRRAHCTINTSQNTPTNPEQAGHLLKLTAGHALGILVHAPPHYAACPRVGPSIFNYLCIRGMLLVANHRFLSKRVVAVHCGDTTCAADMEHGCGSGAAQLPCWHFSERYAILTALHIPDNNSEGLGASSTLRSIHIRTIHHGWQSHSVRMCNYIRHAASTSYSHTSQYCALENRHHDK